MKCTKCGLYKSLDCFYRHKRIKKSGVRYYVDSWCKKCSSKATSRRYKIRYNTDVVFREKRKEHTRKYFKQLRQIPEKHQQFLKRHRWRSRKYKLSVRRAITAWTEWDRIAEFYQKCPEGFHVDHIIPLNAKEACGLHVIANLQYLPAKINCSKKNKMEV